MTCPKRNDFSLYFRDYLLDYPKIAKEYEELKLKLWKTYEHNRDEYTKAKTDFVTRYTEKAKELYTERYNDINYKHMILEQVET